VINIPSAGSNTYIGGDGNASGLISWEEKEMSWQFQTDWITKKNFSDDLDRATCFLLKSDVSPQPGFLAVDW